MRKYTIVDCHGWPVEKIKGRPIINLLRLLIDGRGLKPAWMFRPMTLKEAQYEYDKAKPVTMTEAEIDRIVQIVMESATSREDSKP